MPDRPPLPSLGSVRPLQDSPIVGTVTSGPGWLRTRIEEHIDAHGLAYPWWIPVVAICGQVGAVAISLSLRDALWNPEWVTLSIVLVLLPGVLMVVFSRHMPHLLETFGGLAAAAWLLSDPVSTGTGFDTAPALLALITAEVVARDGVRNGLVVGGISLGLISAAAGGPGLLGAPVHLVDIPLGFVVGYMMLWQMRALAAERAAREGEHARATLAERERIAREIHDLVAHSLSVTLLQITGARHALRDLDSAEAAPVVAEIDDALSDAERVGRQAMADIRQTVSTLADGPAATQALPGGSEIADLVAQMERAGLAVDYEQTGDPARLAQATGLGLYRIAQESLANIAKHAPASTARVRFSVTSKQARLVVRNALPAPARSNSATIDGCGSGLAGMSARAEQLGATLAAQQTDGDWLVDLKVPLRERNGLLSCPWRSGQHGSGRVAW